MEKQNQPNNYKTFYILVTCLLVEDYLELLCKGYSNESIIRRIGTKEMTVDALRVLLQDVCNTTGWEYDLDFSPLACYNQSNGNFDAYIVRAKQVSAIDYSIEVYTIGYNMSKLYHSVRKVVDLFYGNS